MLSRKVIALTLATGHRNFMKIGVGHHQGYIFKGTQPEDLGHAKPEYDMEFEREQRSLQQIQEYDRLLEAESQHIQQLRKEGREQEYNPSLEPNTVCVKAMKIPYWSPQLRAQTPEQTAAAKDNIRNWYSKIHGCKVEERKALVEQLIAETPYLVVFRQSRLETSTSTWEYHTLLECRYHGMVPGVEGFVPFQHNQNEDLMEEFVEVSGVTMFPQAFIGGKSIGDWRDMTALFNSGKMIPSLESVGLQSKMKGTYYYENIALVKH